MKIAASLVAALALVLVVPSSAGAKKKKPNRGMLESMQSVPCGVKQRGVSGLGSVFASIGVEHVNSNEKLCPQYLLRTDEMDYQIRPLDMKHAVLLSVGHEGEFKIKKNRLFLKVPDEDKKARAYEVVSMQPVNSGAGEQSSANRAPERPAESKPEKAGDNPDNAEKQLAKRPPQ